MNFVVFGQVIKMAATMAGIVTISILLKSLIYRLPYFFSLVVLRADTRGLPA